MIIPKEWLNFLRDQFPKGSRIRLRTYINDALEPGNVGVLDYITDNARFCVTWENGQHTELTLSTDRFSVLPPKLQTLKLYMPLTADVYGNHGHGDSEGNPTELDGRQMIEYKDLIAAALRENCLSEESERGIMRWYSEDNAVDIKVHSVFIGVEERASRLWGVAECCVAGTLSQAELIAVKQYLIDYVGPSINYAGDSWGEIFAQSTIQLNDGEEMYVHFWNREDWTIRTEEEQFGPETLQSSGHTLL